MNYINKYSWKSFLSTATREVHEENGFYWFKTRKNWQLLKDRDLVESDLDFIGKLLPVNFFYFSLKDIFVLKQKYEVSKNKDPDVGIKLDEFILRGNKYKDIRNYVNRYNNKFEIVDNYKNMEDVYKMIARWDDTSGDKYYQVRTGKNKYYFLNNLHKGCINVFIYDGDKLISFAVLSPADEGGYSSYIIGKALCIDYPGLSEYTDVEVYKRAIAEGVKVVNLGGGGRKLVAYKKKFPGSFTNDTYDGQIYVI